MILEALGISVLIINELKTDKKENQDIGWFDIKNPPRKIGWQSHKQIIKLLQEELKEVAS